MAVVLKRLYNGYFYMMEEWADPRSDDYFLMSTPLTIIAIVTCYFYFIYNWGPKFMENRPAYDLRNVLIAYNVFQIFANLYIVYVGIVLMKDISWRCTEIDYTEKGRYFLEIVHVYFLTKVTDLFDTVFFVLRKKTRHVNFLHVYHHFGMATVTWIATKFIGGGHVYYLGFVNAIVHVIMYSYYLLSAIDSRYGRMLRLKKFITQVQLAQFAFLFVVYVKLLLTSDCGFPKIVPYVLIPQNLFMAAMFTDFYVKTYVLKKNKDGHEKKT